MSEYQPTIGLEIHAELKTQTKMFCDSKNDTSEERPNVNICPVCMGYPGSLPVINKEAVRLVLSLGIALGGEIADFTEFDRKNYFYPDIPKGYQISQYKHPLVKGGELAGVKITRIHLEEDTAKSTHDKGDESLLDFNRAGVPLMELVTEPVIHSGETAAKFAKELQLILIYLKASEANMEKGEMRVEANISISKDSKLGTKVEVKNLNSFKAVEKAIQYEVKRQEDLLERGESVLQETRGWDENKEETFSQRQKEESHDYRYFPDPDLPKLSIKDIEEFSYDNLKASLPELPEEKRGRYKKDFGLMESDTEIYMRDPAKGEYFEKVVQMIQNKELVKTASNYITSELKSFIDAEQFGEVVKMIGEGIISSRGAKEIIKILSTDGGKSREIAESKKLIQKSDEGELKLIAEKIILDNKNVVDDYKKGNAASLQFLVGQGMKATGGSANPEILKKVFTELL